MRRAFILLILSTLPAWAASPAFMFSDTNQLIAAPIPRVNTNLWAILSGHTNKNDGWGGVFEFVTNNAATIDWTNVFPASVSNARWRRVNQPVGTHAPASLTVDANFEASSFSGFGVSPTTSTRIGTGGTTLAGGGQGIDLYLQSTVKAIADSDTLYGIKLQSTLDDDGYAGITKWSFYNATAQPMYLGSGAVNISGLTASRVVATDGSKNLVSVGAPAADGYILSSTTGGTLSWVANAAGSSGGNPTASVGLSAVNGAATTFLRSDGAPALDQGIIPTWTGLHTWTGGQRFSATTAYNASPTTELIGYLKYTSGGAFNALAQIQIGKENATDGNNAGYLALSTRPNGGSVTEWVRLKSDGIMYFHTAGINSSFLSAKLEADSGSRFEITSEGTIFWGSGSGPVSGANLFLTSPGQLKFGGSLIVETNLTVNGLTPSLFVKTDGTNRLVSAAIANSDLPTPAVVPSASPYAITRKTNNSTATTNDVTMIFNGATGNPITNTLPVTSVFDGHMFIIMRNGGDSLVIEQSGSGTMETLNTGWAVRAYMWLHTESRYQLLWSQPGT